MRPFADRMMELMVGTARAATSVHGLPLLQRRDVQTVAILPLTGDRGLAGAFNAQVLRHATALDRQLRADGASVRWLVAGRKGASSLRFRGYEVDKSWTGFSDRPAYTDAQALAHRLAELYVEEEIDRAVIVYNHFVSPLVQTVVEQDVLPIPEEMLEAGDTEREAALLGDVIYEPEPEEILTRLLPFYLETEIYRALLESAASEQGARMTAMRNASKNAGELIDGAPARDEPRATGGDHAGDPRGRRGRRCTDAVAKNPRLHSNADALGSLSVALLLATRRPRCGLRQLVLRPGADDHLHGAAATTGRDVSVAARTTSAACQTVAHLHEEGARPPRAPAQGLSGRHAIRQERVRAQDARPARLHPAQTDQGAPLVRLPQRPRRHLRCEVGRVGPRGRRARVADEESQLGEPLAR